MEKNYLKNLFDLRCLTAEKTETTRKGSPNMVNEEIFETIVNGHGDFKVERIISTGQATPHDEVYDQEKDELVFLLEGYARLLFTEDNKEVEMKKGDYLFIKAHSKHRVVYTSKEPPCVWLAIHGSMNL